MYQFCFYVFIFFCLNTNQCFYLQHLFNLQYATRDYERGGDGQFHKNYKEIQQRVCNRETTPLGAKFLRRRKRNSDLSDSRANAKNESFDFIVWLDEMSDFNMPNVTDDEQNREFSKLVVFIKVSMSKQKSK
jgi:hypothetical protein